MKQLVVTLVVVGPRSTWFLVLDSWQSEGVSCGWNPWNPSRTVKPGEVQMLLKEGVFQPMTEGSFCENHFLLYKPCRRYTFIHMDEHDNQWNWAVIKPYGPLWSYTGLYYRIGEQTLNNSIEGSSLYNRVSLPLLNFHSWKALGSFQRIVKQLLYAGDVSHLEKKNIHGGVRCLLPGMWLLVMTGAFTWW